MAALVVALATLAPARQAPATPQAITVESALEFPHRIPSENLVADATPVTSHAARALAAESAGSPSAPLRDAVGQKSPGAPIDEESAREQKRSVAWSAAMLLVAGAILIGVELHVSAGGALGVFGLIFAALGLSALFGRPPIVAALLARVHPAMVSIIAVGLSAGAIALAVVAARSMRNGKVVSGAEAMVGGIGEVASDDGLAPTGKVFYQGTLWDATTALPSPDSPRPLAKGASVRIVQVNGLRLVVEPA